MYCTWNFNEEININMTFKSVRYYESLTEKVSLEQKPCIIQNLGCEETIRNQQRGVTDFEYIQFHTRRTKKYTVVCRRRKKFPRRRVVRLSISSWTQ